MKKLNVVSFFDGMGCLYIALKELGIAIESYHAYEIDKHAIKAAKALNPNVIHKGDVRFFDIKDYPNGIDIFAGGSPCTDLSFAGKMSGLICNSLPEYMELRNEYLKTKDENLFFHNGKFQQSILFWEWLRALKEIQKVNPKVYFLLENVIMPKNHEYTISKELGIAPIRINANLVSAQNRDRLFWCNISLEPFGLFGDLHCTIPQPKDRGILLKHILESDVKEKYYLSETSISRIMKYNNSENMINNETKSNCLTAGYNKIGRDNTFIKEFTVCLSAGRGEEAKQLRKQGIDKFQDKELMPRNDGKTNCLTSVQKDNLIFLGNVYDSETNPSAGRVYSTDGKSSTLLSSGGGGGAKTGLYAIQVPEATNKGFVEIKPGECFDFENPNSKTRRGRKMEDKSNCLMAQQNQFMQFTEDFRIRRLTPREAGRLQSIPESDLDIMLSCGVSDSQLYRIFGNGWNINVITHILSFINKTKL